MMLGCVWGAPSARLRRRVLMGRPFRPGRSNARRNLRHPPVINSRAPEWDEYRLGSSSRRCEGWANRSMQTFFAIMVFLVALISADQLFNSGQITLRVLEMLW